MIKIYDLVEHLELKLETAEDCQLTKNEYIDTLRTVTKEKIIAVKEVKSMFHNRMKYFIAAQKYAVRCERTVAVENSRKLVLQMAK
jgi:hypothetical protein